ncbi:MAG: carbohydrate kinase family protein [Clostridiales bacterium]|jgi:sugar/nucleoside kinase (ribokinase family)|nr:carbohydrate kinase family protein [Clostridiales bacterium]
MSRKGICVAGNLIVDVLYPLSNWPRRGELVTILSDKEMAGGGLAFNTPMSLSMLDEKLPITILGNIGPDAEGDQILKYFATRPNINTDGIARQGSTSYTLVLNDMQTMERTFFQYRGANADFDGTTIPWESLNARMFHAGYILLMDGLDAPDEEYGTKMARMLHRAQQEGMKTSVDVVSEASDRFRHIVPPALKYTDYCIINEYEAQQITGVPLKDVEADQFEQNIPKALEALHGFGVREWAVIHCPQGGYGMDAQGQYISLPSLRLPRDYVKGTTGAGDAFCAGVLYGAHEGMMLADAIRLGTASAAGSLGEKDTYSGVQPADQMMDFYRRMGGV